MRHVVVVGAGVGGPALAMWLRRVGIEPSVVEARPDRAGEGAFLGLAPNGLAAIEGLGLAERVEARGHACVGFSFLDRRGRELGSIDRRGDRERFGHPLTMIRRADLHAELAGACAEAGVAIGYGRPLVAVDQRPDGVVARLGDGSALEADLLVGCDGLRSATRALCLPDAPAPTFSGLLDFGGFAQCDAPIPPGVNVMVFGVRAFFGAFRTATGEVWWFHNGPPTDEALDAEGHRARLLDLHAGDVGWVGDVIRSTPSVLGPWRIHELRAMRRWWAGRVGLIGDAAHAMSPSAGQGASLALEDAQALAMCLRGAGADALARFEAARRPRVDAMFRAAQRNGSGKALGPIAAWFRDRILPWALRGAGEAQAQAYRYRIDDTYVG